LDFSAIFGRFSIHVTLAEKQQKLRDELTVIDDPHERLAAVVNRARQVVPLHAGERTDANRVRGCVSAVWLVGEARDGRCHFRYDADGPLVKGLVALLCDFFSDVPPAEIVATETDPLAALDLVKNLSPTRRNGLTAVHARIKEIAQLFQNTPPAEKTPR